MATLLRSARVRWTLLITAALALALGLLFGSRTPALPSALVQDIPPDCKQLLLVLSPSPSSVAARLWCLHRSSPLHSWQVQAGPHPATLGHKGLAWGIGLHTSSAPSGLRHKQEGDKCSPAGLFALPFTFGIAPSAPQLLMPYVALTDTVIGVDDPQSKHYNQVVDSSLVTRDWGSHEPMRRWGDLYAWGAFIAHNPKAEPHRGSCIFLHRWPAPGKGTAGCTALSAQHLQQTIAWLDSSQQPHLLQAVEGW
jgi:L,D-peptidoglycan transpeptidase YkuD (ErfK/YbiS/YcfS/YnhG family)